MINNLLSRLKAPIPVSDRILETAAGIIAIALFVTTTILYSMSPDTIPTHFSLSGEVNDWSDKIFYWLISSMFAVFMLITFISAYYTDKNSVLMPIRNKDMSPRQIKLAARLCRIINLALALIWLDVLLSVSAVWLGIDKSAITLMNIISVIFFVMPSVWYGIKIYRSKIQRN